MTNTKLPEAELHVMQAIWQMAAPVTIGGVLAALRPEKDWKPQTLTTLFTRLVARGLLRKEGEGKGREHKYYPLLTQEEYLRRETERFIEHTHEGSVLSLIASLRGAKMSAQELEELRDFVKQSLEGS